MAAQTDRGVPLSTLCPKFLHTNSTSHTWPFSAIAELIDNAYDPDVLAKQFWIDKTVVSEEECLSFMDNGNGLDVETMHKMLSFGYSDKTAVDGVQPIGIYGNGFKSGSMRLGRDAIVFSKSKNASCVGMLSQSYLEKIDAQQIVVPMVLFEQTGAKKFSVKEEHKASLQDILRYSPFKTEEELLTEINAIGNSWSAGKTGTRIIIWNLRSTSTGTEFDFQTNRYDIRIPSDVHEDMSKTPQNAVNITSYNPESVYSLRAYCSILYLKPRMQIIIRGQKVKSQLIAKSLACIMKDRYKPTFLTKPIPITFGYNTKSKDQYGIMMYHKNRLIKAYERVGCQLKANNKGVGVIGVIECNYLDPTHNKQSFLETDKYRKTFNNLGIKLEEYWNEIRYTKNKENPNSAIPLEDTMKRPDQNWVQCDYCLRWRKLPDGIDCSKLPDKWFCQLNPDPQFRSCQVEEEPEDSDDDQPSYRKTYKQQEKEDKKKQDTQRQKIEEEQRHQEELRLANLAKQNKALRRQLRETAVRPPSTPITPKSRSLQGGAARAESSPLGSSTISQAACSPSSSSGLPIITNVRSLSPAAPRGKRLQPVTPQRTPKRPRVNRLDRVTSDAPPSVDAPFSPSVINENDDTDDDIFILETTSTPKPKKTGLDLSKVEIKHEPIDSNVDMLMECSDDAAVDNAPNANAAGTGPPETAATETSPSPAPPLEVASITTQTEAPKIKEESQTEESGGARQSTSNESGAQLKSDVGGCSIEQRLIKQDRNDDSHSETLLNGMNYLDSDENAGPSCAKASDKKSSPPHIHSMAEVQEQQDQLLQLMQVTAQERDSFKEQVSQLTCQLEDMQSRLQELSRINVKKELSHQANQTEETEDGKDYKSLFEKAKQKVDELIKEKEAFLTATEATPSTSVEKDMDEIALQVDCLVRELDQRNKERDELRSQLDSLEEEKAKLASQCEELKLSLRQQKEEAQKGSIAQLRTSDSSAQTDPVEAEGTADSGTASTSDTLIELRQNVGRLLVSFVPALDLAQVNFECNVLDEILEQVLSDEETVEKLIKK
ncbi:MORC family CW-type zinc finger protein 3a isoform X1 [Scomber scombrus]|uniref:MORC family CW-type zinc finger protein 3a isoform X1 n=1 Tax=Scomber scombrus TaxID=13677 RepID=UPI002DD87466|nr:MORC family CW-type zinc finger protein 3a isoform X1 [Scomber scombrus]